jgi:quercetin dioxygenase-like cupin family protein
MTSGKISERFENGSINSLLESKKTGMIEWNEHKAFKGVYLKHVITGADTNGDLSCHLVRVNPGCTLDTHVHEGKMEMHQVIEGSGLCVAGGREIKYIPGAITLIPADTAHKVTAGDEGIFMLAVFSRALL